MHVFSSQADIIRTDKTVQSVLCLAWCCEVDSCHQRVQTSYFLSATVLSRQKSSSHRRDKHDTDSIVLSGQAWLCELVIWRLCAEGRPFVLLPFPPVNSSFAVITRQSISDSAPGAAARCLFTLSICYAYSIVHGYYVKT